MGVRFFSIKDTYIYKIFSDKFICKLFWRMFNFFLRVIFLLFFFSFLLSEFWVYWLFDSFWLTDCPSIFGTIIHRVTSNLRAGRKKVMRWKKEGLLVVDGLLSFPRRRHSLRIVVVGKGGKPYKKINLFLWKKDPSQRDSILIDLVEHCVPYNRYQHSYTKIFGHIHKDVHILTLSTGPCVQKNFDYDHFVSYIH